jgi:hypothetical protein
LRLLGNIYTYTQLCVATQAQTPTACPIPPQPPLSILLALSCPTHTHTQHVSHTCATTGAGAGGRCSRRRTSRGLTTQPYGRQAAHAHIFWHCGLAPVPRDTSARGGQQQTPCCSRGYLSLPALVVHAASVAHIACVRAALALVPLSVFGSARGVVWLRELQRDAEIAEKVAPVVQGAPLR